jgi:hypothetical protein
VLRPVAEFKNRVPRFDLRACGKKCPWDEWERRCFYWSKWAARKATLAPEGLTAEAGLVLFKLFLDLRPDEDGIAILCRFGVEEPQLSGWYRLPLVGNRQASSSSGTK